MLDLYDSRTCLSMMKVHLPDLWRMNIQGDPPGYGKVTFHFLNKDWLSVAQKDIEWIEIEHLSRLLTKRRREIYQ